MLATQEFFLIQKRGMMSADSKHYSLRLRLQAVELWIHSCKFFKSSSTALRVLASDSGVEHPCPIVPEGNVPTGALFVTPEV